MRLGTAECWEGRVLRNLIRAAQNLLLVAEIVAEVVSELVSRIFERRREVLFLIFLIYGIALATYSLFKVRPEFLASVLEDKWLPALAGVTLGAIVALIFFGLRPLFKESSYE